VLNSSDHIKSDWERFTEATLLPVILDFKDKLGSFTSSDFRQENSKLLDSAKVAINFKVVIWFFIMFIIVVIN
jgi:uncharacterized Tic20 family protein